MLDARHPIPVNMPVEVTLNDSDVVHGDIAAVTTMLIVIDLGDEYAALPYTSIKQIVWEA